jgi:hypothetical protein
VAHSHHDHAGHTHDHSDHDHPHPGEHGPEFEITLSAGHLDDLARVIVTWSQIEFLITNIVALLAKSDVPKTTMQLEAMTIETRVDHLRSLIPRIANDRARQDAAGICDELGALVPRRNHALHGLWGDFIDYEGKKAVAACFYGPSNERPIFATGLSEMGREAASLSRRLGALLAALAPAFTASSPRRFFFSDRPPPAGPLPDWHP